MVALRLLIQSDIQIILQARPLRAAVTDITAFRHHHRPQATGH